MPTGYAMELYFDPVAEQAVRELIDRLSGRGMVEVEDRRSLL